MNALPTPYLTPGQYLEIERQAETRNEYFDGEMFAMSGGSRAHSRLSVNVTALLNGILAGRPCEVFNSDMRVKVEATDLYTYPDVSVVCGEPRLEDAHQDTLLNPLLIVEVLSPSTERYDRGTKFHHYRQISSLMEYVLVSQDEARIERFQRLPDGEWSLRVASGLDAELSLSSIDVTLKLADVYHKVTLLPTRLHGPALTP